VASILGAGCVAVLTALSFGPTAAHAQATGVPAQATTQEIDSFALAPTGSDPSQPGSRPYLSYSLAPGATQTDSVTLWNYGNSQLTFHVYSPDAFNNIDGAFALQDGKKPARDAGAWVKLERNYVTLPPGTKTDIAVTMTVPQNASPGDHTAAIVASNQTPGSTAEGKHVLIDRRTGSRLYVRVTGPVNPAIAVENMSSVYHPALNPLDGKLDVTYTVRNTGNVRLGAHQKIEVHDLFGSVASRASCPTLTADAGAKARAAAKTAAADHCVPDLPELLPGNAVTRSAEFTGVAATVRVTGEVTLVPFAAPGATGAKLPKLSATSASKGAWAIPWALVVLLVLLGAVIWFARRRRARPIDQGRGPEGGTGASGGSAPGSAPESARADGTRVPAALRAVGLRRAPAAPAP
jgi:hypothetical protein